MRTHGTHTNSVEDGEVLGMVQPKKGRTGTLRAEKLFRKNLSKSEVKREGWRGRQKSHRRGVGTLECSWKVLSRGHIIRFISVLCGRYLEGER